MTDRVQTVSAIVLAYGREPWLERCVDAVLASHKVDVSVIIVDNGCTDGAVERLNGRERLLILRPEKNLGFTGGCNLAARHANGEVLAFVNSDALVDALALANLSSVALRPGVGIASASLRLADDPSKINSAGNPIHFLGVSWAGGFGEFATSFADEKEVAGATGAAMAVRRDVWNQLGGFEECFFAYHEDADLSMRCHLAGLRVLYVPDAIVVHRYEFSRNARKYYLLVRNRLVSMLTLLEARTLVLVAPALLSFEIGTFLIALRRGRWREKVAAWMWVVRNLPWLLRRRANVQEKRVVRDRDVVRLLTGSLKQNIDPLPWLWVPFDRLLEGYWYLVQRVTTIPLRRRKV